MLAEDAAGWYTCMQITEQRHPEGGSIWTAEFRPTKMRGQTVISGDVRLLLTSYSRSAFHVGETFDVRLLGEVVNFGGVR